MNLIKTNDITKNLFKELKIIYENKLLQIECYDKILFFDNEKIILKEIIIYGKDLKIIYIDKYSIKVSGIITLVERVDNNE